MTTEIYQKLAVHLDNLPGGYASPDNEAGLRILQRLFTPQEAELAVYLTLIAETPGVIAHRANIKVLEAETRLEEMAQKGLIFRITSKTKPVRYMAAQFVVGIWEYQVNNLSPELVQDMEQLFEELIDFEVWQKAPQLRTIPIGESIEPDMQIMAYEQAEDLIRSQERITLAPCICRRERNMVGEGCDKPVETCISLGGGADFYLENGLGRRINQQQALDVLSLADDSGLVLQVSNSQKAAYICCCCGDCCAVLRNIKRHPQPARIASSPFQAQIDTEICDACATCEDRCQMGAVLVNGTASIDKNRCIGCGLCVTTCPNDAIFLVRKPADEQVVIPESYAASLIHLGQTRGKLSNTELVKMMMKSRIDRLMALPRK